MPYDRVVLQLEAAVRDLATEMMAEGPVAVSVARRRDPVTATNMSAKLRRHLATAADARVRDGWTEMPSAAAHDAMVIAAAVLDVSIVMRPLREKKPRTMRWTTSAAFCQG